MRAVIISSGSIADYNYINTFIKDNDMIICADGGYKHAVALGAVPFAVVGDFDSNTPFIPSEIKKIVYPKDKDYTDTFLAVQAALAAGCSEFLFLGATGSRYDHTLANVSILKYLSDKGLASRIVDEYNEIFIIRDIVEIEGRQGDTISLLPLFETAEGIETEGLLYSLAGGTLEFGISIGISNVIISQKAVIKLKKGLLIGIIAKP